MVVVASVHAEAIPTPTPTPAELESKPEPTPETRSMAWHEGLMAKVGIRQSDWYFVNCVIAGCERVSGEGSWQGVERWNFAGSGAYGICQALPASKMASAGADYMTNIETQLRWCHSYAQERYGGWSAAWAFRKCVGKCWQPVYKTWTYKDHTWW